MKKYKICVLIINLFCLINILWILMVNLKYSKFTKAVPKNELKYMH